MKRIFLFLVQIFLIASFAHAQQSSAIDTYNFKNDSFEEFEADNLNGGTACGGYQPKYWRASNVNQTVIGVNKKQTLIFQDTDVKRTGNSSVRMENTWVGAVGIGSNAPGYITLGTVWVYATTSVDACDGGSYGGISFTHRPDSLVFYVQRNVDKGNEVGKVLVYSWKGSATAYNTTEGKTKTNQERVIFSKYRNHLSSFDSNVSYSNDFELVGAAEYNIPSENINSWRRISIPIEYLTNNNPDQLNIVIAGTNYFVRADVVEGNKLWVDDIKFVYNPYINGVVINGNRLNEFSSKNYSYRVKLPVGTTTYPVINIEKNPQVSVSTSWENVDMTKGFNGTYKVVSESEDKNSSVTYTIEFTTELSSDATLKSISYETLEGVQTLNIVPGKFSYNVELPYGTTEMPTFVSAVKNQANATVISSASENLPGRIDVVSTAQDGETQLSYTINFSVAKSASADIISLVVDGMNAVKIDNYNYRVTMPQGSTEVPGIETYAVTVSDKATYEITNAANLSSKAKITVTAEDQIHVNTYYVSFVVPVSSNTSLADLKVNGTTVEGFDASVTNYSMVMDYLIDASDITITALPEDESSSVVVDQITSNEQKNIRITVTAESGAVKYYYVSFVSNNANLSALKVAGDLIAGFDQNVLDYNYELPYGTTVSSLPLVTSTSASTRAKTRLYKATTIPGTAVVTVTAEDGVTQKSYSINFDVKKNPDASVAYISIKNEGVEVGRVNSPVAGDNAVELVYGTTQIDEIEVVTTNENIPSENITKEFTGVILDGASVRVLAEDGITEATYNLSFTIGKSNNANLKNLTVNGSQILGFVNNKVDYKVIYTSAELPVVMAEVEDPTAEIISIQQVSALPGEAIIKVKAENDDVVTYTIDFSVELDNAKLQNILIDDVVVANLVPEVVDGVTTYSISLPYGTETAKVTIEPEVAGLNVTAQILPFGEEFQGSTFTAVVSHKYEVVITAQDGVNENVFNVVFDVEKNDNANLKALSVVGYALNPIFNKNNLTYSVERPYGETSIPVVRYELDDPKTATAELTVQEVQSGYTAEVVVTAQNGDTKVYTINFTNAKNDDASLKLLSVNGTTIELKNEVFEYALELPYGTIELPAVVAEANDANANVDVQVSMAQVDIRVTSENEENILDYVVVLTIAKNDNANLASIAVDGLEVEGFNPDKSDYLVVLPSWQVAVPEVTVVLQDENATYTVDAAESLLEKTTITVVSENKEVTKKYTVAFQTGLSDVCTLDNIYLDGVALRGFNPVKTTYNVVLDKGTEGLPELTYDLTDAKSYAVVYRQESSISILVVSQDQNNSTNYVVNFEVAKSTNNALEGIYIDGELIENFDNATNSYSIEVPYSKTLPTVTAVAADQDAIVTISKYSDLNNPIMIKSVSEDGNNESTFYLTISMAKSSDATLSAIRVDGTLIADFNPNVFEYTAYVAYQSLSALVAYDKSNENSTVTIESNNLEDGLLLRVVSEDESVVNDYKVTLIERKNPNTDIDQVYVNGDLLGFMNKGLTNYDVYLPYGASNIDLFSCVLVNPNARYEYTPAESANGVALITVYPEDELAEPFVYTITLYPTVVSNEARITNVKINGVAYDDFDSNKTGYVIMYNPNAALPVLTYETIDETATSECTQVTEIPGVAKVVVTATDGTELTYNFRFKEGEVGVEDEFSTQIKMYPMPVETELNVENNSSENLLLTIYSTNGSLLKVENISSNSKKVLNLQALSTGNYIYRVNSGRDVVKSGLLIKK